jgi:hypothetical protein
LYRYKEVMKELMKKTRLQKIEEEKDAGSKADMPEVGGCTGQMQLTHSLKPPGCNP